MQRDRGGWRWGVKVVIAGCVNGCFELVSLVSEVTMVGHLHDAPVIQEKAIIRASRFPVTHPGLTIL